MVQSFYICRNIVLGLSLALGLAGLGLIAHWTQGFLRAFGIVSNFEIFGLIVGSLTAISLPILLVISEFRKNAYISYVIVELPWLLVLWVLWLTTGVLAIQQMPFQYPFGCGAAYLRTGSLRQWCIEGVAIGRICIVTSALLIVYWLALLMVACVLHFRGNPVWARSVKDIFSLTSASQATVQPPINANLNLHHANETRDEFSPYTPQFMGHTPMITPGLSTPTTSFAPSAAYAHMTSALGQPDV